MFKANQTRSKYSNKHRLVVWYIEWQKWIISRGLCEKSGQWQNRSIRSIWNSQKSSKVGLIDRIYSLFDIFYIIQ